ncbi:MAG: hypothetical protein HY909_19095 [Deltaproteobacteria bacterium]|nr:hypothetical protein [Deltaproteobacteria bacterium]
MKRRGLVLAGLFLLGGCSSGDGTDLLDAAGDAATADTPAPDAPAPDSAAPDAAPTDTQAPPADTALRPPDSTPPVDSGAPPTDSPLPPPDSRVPPEDTGAPRPDAAPPEDRGPPPVDRPVPPDLPPPEDTAAPADTAPPDAPEPDGPAPTDAPASLRPFADAAGLCRYINESRTLGAAHMRFRGEPPRGEYHTMRYWPTTFTVDAALSAQAMTEALRIAAGGGPRGRSHTCGIVPSGPLCQYLYVQGLDTASTTYAAQEFPADWGPGTLRAAFSVTNAVARLLLYHHDTGAASFGPRLTRIGCGAAPRPDGTSWWVAILAP